MVIDITLDNALTFGSLIVGGAFTLWMRSVSAHNKLSEQRSESMQEELKEVWKSNNALRDCLQETRENYVTNARFDKFIESITADLKAILQKLENKHDRADCGDCAFNRRRRKGDDDD